MLNRLNKQVWPGAMSWSAPALVLGAVGALYLSTLAINHTEAEDAIHYVQQVAGDEWRVLFHPNHLLFGIVNRVTFEIWRGLGYTGTAEAPMQVNNVLASLATLTMVYLLARRLRCGLSLALLVIVTCASSYGFWWYSVEAETYLMPLPFVLLAIHLTLSLASSRFELWWFFFLGLVCSGATLLHQQHVLLTPLIGLVLVHAWCSKRKWVPVARLVCGLTLFGLTFGAVVLTTYTAAAVWVAECSGVLEIIRWAMGYAADGLWTPWSAMNPIKAGVGMARAILGGHFLFSFSCFDAVVSRAFAGKMLVEERFLAQSISPTYTRLCLLTTTLSLLAGGMLVVLSGRGFIRARRLAALKGRKPEDSVIALFMCMFMAYGVFNTVWEPQNIEFWIVLLPVGALVFALGLRYQDGRRLGRWLGWLFASTLFITNLFGSVLPQTSRDADYWYVANEPLIANARQGDIIITGAGYISDGYLRFYTDATVLSVDRLAPGKLLELADRQTAGRVYISSWAEEPLPTVAKRMSLEELAQCEGAIESLRDRLEVYAENDHQTVWCLRK